MLRKFLKKEAKDLLVELVFEFIVDAFLEKIASGFVLGLVSDPVLIAVVACFGCYGMMLWFLYRAIKAEK